MYLLIESVIQQSGQMENRSQQTRNVNREVARVLGRASTSNRSACSSSTGNSSSLHASHCRRLRNMRRIGSNSGSIYVIIPKRNNTCWEFQWLKVILRKRNEQRQTRSLRGVFKPVYNLTRTKFDIKELSKGSITTVKRFRGYRNLLTVVI